MSRVNSTMCSVQCHRPESLVGIGANILAHYPLPRHSRLILIYCIIFKNVNIFKISRAKVAKNLQQRAAVSGFSFKNVDTSVENKFFCKKKFFPKNKRIFKINYWDRCSFIAFNIPFFHRTCNTYGQLTRLCIVYVVFNILGCL